MSEHFDVLVVGAGLSGVGAGYWLQKQCPGKSYAIIEARGRKGGTWDLFRYPGIRPIRHVHARLRLQAVDRSKAIADGPSILRYIDETARAYGIDEKIRYNERMVSASFSSEGGAMEGRGKDGGGREDLHLRLPLHVHRLPLRERLHAGLCRHGRLSRDNRASAGLAGRSRLFRQEGRRHRIGRDRDDARAGNGEDGRAM